MKAIEITPTTTVVDKLLVQTATINVGINAPKIGQSSVTNDVSVLSKFSITKALNIQMGINDSHFNTTSGNFTLRTKINGITLGSHVTSAHPTITQRIVVKLIDPSPPQQLPQRSSRSVRLHEMA